MEKKKIEKLLKSFSKIPRMNFFQDSTFEYDSTLEEIMKVLRNKSLDILSGTTHIDFEKKFAEWLGVKHAIFVSSGTAALFIALRAADIGPGDEVIVPPFTFIASASSVLHNNATPVFADIEFKTYNMDPQEAINKITEKTKAIMPVHLAGMPQDLDPLIEVCHEKNIFLLEDACQSHGAKYKGKHVGTLGDAGAFSFYPSKNMTTGEGGMITTNNDELAEQSRIIRHHGESAWYEFARLGWHYRPTELQAAIGLAQLRIINKNIRNRQKAWFYLTENLRDIPGIKVPDVPEYAEPSCNWWPGILNPQEVGLSSVDEYTNLLNKKGPFTKILYPKPIYQTKVFQEGDTFLAHKLPEYPIGLCPKCEHLNQVLIGIETHPEMKKEQCDFIINRFKTVANEKK